MKIYSRCWEIIEKNDPDMFNNDSPYPRISTGKGLGIKPFTDFLNRDLKENDGKLYAYVLAPPTADLVIRTLAAGGLYANEILRISMLGIPESLEWTRDGHRSTIQLPEEVPNLPVIGFEITSTEK